MSSNGSVERIVHPDGSSDIVIRPPVAGQKRVQVNPFDRGGDWSHTTDPSLKADMLMEEVVRLHNENSSYRAAASTMANMALCFAQILVDHGVQVSGDREVTVPRWLSDKMMGLAITVRANPGEDIVVSIRERDRVETKVAYEE